ncbi:two-component sensor histidine kinase [Paenibacillus sp. FSL A5-0031]|uniref:sensor histidine kinase n=1 Tax=Paenibacillus sp. FSL A5-0031 TaxID=1920420 RepID=UPI00096E378A|nr:HAMP domain-containing sensor histidine kinase [Paenibacillus sp. FSL A5-0031]OME82279.1 two-component sensor histidine kinase [Paenibacillus sp. FSL A5-0031]
MKLVHQINLAFGIALVLVLSITALLIHYVLLDHFMVAQKEELKMASATLSATMKTEMVTQSAEDSRVTLSASALSINPSIKAVVTDTQGNIMQEVLPMQTLQAGKASSTETAAITSVGKVVDGTDKGFLVEVNAIPQGTLTLFTPVSKIKEIEQALLKRLLLVFGLGGMLMLVLSHLITRKLIKPLMKLKEELTKVKSRQFSKVKRVKAGGEIGSVAQVVFEMADELNRFNRAQKQFFQNASHELKSPLMSIAGYAEGIRDGVFEGESVYKGLDIILSESDRLKNLVTEMTLLAKLDSEEDIYQPSLVCLKDLLAETIERVNPMLVKKGITLHPSYDEHEQLIVRADQDKLLQAMLNVVTNAIRHADKNIYIHASAKKGRIEISVSDDGGGIPDELLPYLFHRFVKGKDGESGLGLAISRAIVERCGGLITAGNNKGGGAIFSLGFPLAA